MSLKKVNYFQNISGDKMKARFFILFLFISIVTYSQPVTFSSADLEINKTIYDGNWQVMIYKKSWFKKLTSKDKNGWFYKYFKFDAKEIKENVTLS